MKYFLLLLLAIFTLQIQAQFTSKKKSAIVKFQEAVQSYRMMQANEAIELCKMAIDKDENFVEPHDLLGDIYIEQNNFDSAYFYYNRVLQMAPNYKPILFFKTAQVSLKLGKYAEAKSLLENYKAINGGEIPKPLRDRYGVFYGNAVFGEEAIKNPVPFDPINLGKGVNTQGDDYHPSVTVDGKKLVFTRKEPVGRTRSGGLVYKEDLYFSNKNNEEWSNAYNYGPPVNTPGFNEGSSCISHDGKYLFFTACNLKGGFGSCDIYVSEKQGRSWSKPVNMGKRINTGSWESHPSLAPDGKTLYFSSNRPGGKGGVDIWRSRIGEDGLWGEPENLEINTKFSDMTPSVHGDAYTMYFASNGLPGMGNHDIYVCRINADGSFTKPLNLGYPINTTEDEFAMIADPEGRLAYYSSEMEGGMGKLDLYQFELPENVRPILTQSLVGVVFHRDTKEKLMADVELIDLETGKTIASTLSDEQSGEFLAALPSNRDYALNVSKQGFLFYSENFSLKQGKAQSVRLEVPLIPIKAGEGVVLKNVFFETASFELKKESRVELDKLAAMLKNNPELKIEIGGHTDNEGNASSNKTLSLNRAKSVLDYLVSKGISANRMQARGYGADQPIADNNSAEGRAKNRRTEFKVL